MGILARSAYLGAVALRFSALDERRALRCVACSRLALLSFAFAAQQGWEDFEEDGGGPLIGAVCPRCEAPAD